MPVITLFRKQGATRSFHSSKESLKILPWVEWHLATIKTVPLAGAQGTARADQWPVPPGVGPPLFRLPGSSQERQEPCLVLLGPSPPSAQASRLPPSQEKAPLNQRFPLLKASKASSPLLSVSRLEGITRQSSSQINVFNKLFGFQPTSDPEGWNPGWQNQKITMSAVQQLVWVNTLAIFLSIFFLTKL